MAAPIVDLNGRWGGRLRDQDIGVLRSDNLTLRVTVRNTDDSLKDLTGGTVNWGLSKLPGDDTRLTAIGTLSDPTNGELTISLPSTAQLTGVYYHEVQFTESGGDLSTVMRGYVHIDPDSV